MELIGCPESWWKTTDIRCETTQNTENSSALRQKPEISFLNYNFRGVVIIKGNQESNKIQG